MPISYKIDPEVGIVVREYAGTVDLDDFIQHWRKLLNDPDLPESDPILLLGDMRSCQVALDGEKVRRLVETVIEPLMKDRQWLSAIVVSTPVNFGTTKQFSAYSEKCGKTVVFYSMEEAEAWLEKCRKALASNADGSIAALNDIEYGPGVE